MNKTLIKTPAGENLTRYTVRFESDECEKGTMQSRFVQFEMLRTIAGDPQVSMCGASDFQEMKMRHDGAKWVVTLEAVGPT